MHFVKPNISNSFSLPTLHGPFDIIFIDADKKDYIEYYDMIMERKLLAQGGVVLADNVLAHGCTVDPKIGTPQDTAVQNGAELRKFNDHIAKVRIYIFWISGSNNFRMIVLMSAFCQCSMASPLLNGSPICILFSAFNHTSP